MTTVVKVKHEGFLRRFKLSSELHTFANFSAKIRDLFSLPAEAPIHITYVDEDGDHVTMASDSDLMDAQGQGISPLRVFVNKPGASFTETASDVSSGVSTPVRRCPSESVVKEEAKPVVDDSFVVVSSEPAPSIPAETSASDVKPVADVSAVLESAVVAEAAKTDDSVVADAESEGSTVVKPVPEASNDEPAEKVESVPSSTPEVKDSPSAEADTSSQAKTEDATKPKAEKPQEGASKSKEEYLQNLKKIVEENLKTTLKDSGLAEGDVNKAFSHLLEVGPSKIAEVLEACMKLGINASFESVFDKGPGQGFGAPQGQAQGQAQGVPGTCGPTTVDGRAMHVGVQCDICGMLPILGNRFKSLVKHDFDLCETCFNSAGKANEYEKLERPAPRLPGWGRGNPRHMRGQFSNFGPAFPGGFNPRGPHGKWGAPRYSGPYGAHPSGGSSTPGFGPSAASNGAAASGNAAPVNGTPGFTAETACAARFNGPYYPGTAGAPAPFKLDARFVRDVSVFDGTELPPNTPFTKIWRLRNTGTVPWPADVHAVFVGGDKLASVDAVAIQIPEGGVAPDAEVEVSVDMVSPPKPGRYISHWRLLAPGGPKFGHRIWALIQVVMKDEPSPQVAASEAHAKESVKEPAASSAPEVASAPSKTEEAVTQASSALDPARQEAASAAAPAASAAAPTTAGPASAAPLSAAPASVAATSAPAAAPVVNKGKGPAVVNIPVVYTNSNQSAPEPSAPVDFPSGHFAPSAPPSETAADKGKAVASGAAGGGVTGSGKGEDVDDQGFSIVNMPKDGVPGQAPTAKKEPVDEDIVIVETTPSGSSVALPENVPGSVEAAGGSGPSAEAHPRVQAEELLGQLEAMGFTHRGMNAEVLARHDMNVDAAVEELVKVSEWVPLLADLEEMGFNVTDLNLSLLKKHDGSIKRVVKDLVQMYKALPETSA